MPYVIVYQNPGLPAPTTGTVVSGPYSLSGTSTLPSGTGTVTMRTSEVGQAQILGWTGKEWKMFPTKVDGKMATAQVDMLQTYVAVSK